MYKRHALNSIDVVIHENANPHLVSSSPKAYGRDFSGVIIRRGDKVNPKWQVGDEINGLFNHLFGDQGSLSNYLVFNPDKQTGITHIPKSEEDKKDKFIRAAAWPIVFNTAYSVLFKYGQTLGPYSRVLVIGASTTVANAFIQMAKKQLNVGTVVGVCNSDSVEYNKSMGFDYLVSYNQEGTIPENVAKLMEQKKIGKFDLIFDSVGNSDFFPVMDDFLKPKSENSYYLTLVGDQSFEYDSYNFSAFLSGPIRFLNPWRKYRYAKVFGLPTKEGMDLATRMIELGNYNPPIDTIFKFEQFQEAIYRLKSNKAKGKVIISMSD